MIRKFHFFLSPFHHFVECVQSYLRLFICTQTGIWDLPYWISPLVYQCCILTASGTRWYMEHQRRLSSSHTHKAASQLCSTIYRVKVFTTQDRATWMRGDLKILNKTGTASFGDRIRLFLPLEIVPSDFLLSFNYKHHHFSHSNKCQ